MGGRIVSKKQSAIAKKMFASRLGPWNKAVAKARAALKLKGFVPIKKGSPLHQGEGVLEELRLSCEKFAAQTQRSASSRCGAFYACRAHGASPVSRVATDEGTMDRIFNPIVHM